MKSNFEFSEIRNSILVKRITENLFNNKKIEILKRPASFIIKLKHEPEDKVIRIILLPPKGFTANKANETNPHSETRKAKITIKGGVRPRKQGFNLLKNVIKFAYYTKRKIQIKENKPYAKINSKNKFYKEKIKSSKEKFYVVKENGEGLYHNLINLSNEWILMILEKELRLQKEMNLNSKTKDLNKKQQKIFKNLIKAIQNKGDKIFERNQELINKVISIEAEKAIPPLTEALNILETGNHEPCTVYAIILKIGRKKPKKVTEYLKEALNKKEAPKYYLKELIHKLT